MGFERRFRGDFERSSPPSRPAICEATAQRGEDFLYVRTTRYGMSRTSKRETRPSLNRKMWPTVLSFSPCV